MRRGDNAFAAALIGNYSETYQTPATTYVTIPGSTKVYAIPGAPPGWKESVENLQGKLRYDRYFSANFSAFAQVTGTHDAFQAVTFRLNADPGVKYLFWNHPETKLWGEAGYDFQYDDNYTNSIGIEQAGAGGSATDPNGAVYLIQKNDTIHSGRLFAGLQHNFNSQVNLNFGLEYLQGFGGSGGGAPALPAGHTIFNPAALPSAMQLANASVVDPVSISLTGSRLNLDVLLAAKVGAGLSFGIGFNAKYNSAPLAGKEDLDTSTTLTLIYAFGGGPKKEEPKPPTCPCNAPPPDGGAAAPAPGAAPPPPPPAH